MNSLKNFYARLTNQDYVYDEGNLVGVICTNKMLDELEGIVLDSLSIQEELETLRASNTSKQVNIELLEAELAEERKDKVFFKNQFEDLRNSWDNAMINIGKMCGEDLTDEPRFKWASLAVSNVVSERDALLAERESMIKQDPVAVVQQSTYEDDNDLKWLTEFGVHSLEVGDKLYKYSPTNSEADDWLIEG